MCIVCDLAEAHGISAEAAELLARFMALKESNNIVIDFSEGEKPSNPVEDFKDILKRVLAKAEDVVYEYDIEDYIKDIKGLQDFNLVLASRMEKTVAVLKAKGAEYASPESRYHNFYRAAEKYGINPEQALEGMAAKHDISIMDLTDRADELTIDDIPLIEEKIGDRINYLILLEGLFKARVAEKEIKSLEKEYGN